MATWGEYLWSWVTWGTSFVSSPAPDEPAPSDPLDDQHLPDDQTVAQPEAEDQLTEDGFLPANEDDTVAGTSSGANLDHLLTSPQKSRPKRSLQKPPSVAHIRSRKDLRSEPSVTPEPKAPRLGPSMPGAAGPRPVLFDPSAVRLRSSPASSPTSSSSSTDERAPPKQVDFRSVLRSSPK